MPEIWLVCEGKTDRDVLSPVFRTVLGTSITVEVAGGIASLASVAKYLRKDGGVAAYIEDREYRPRAEARTRLTDGSPRFFLARHSIENYFLEPRLLSAAFTRLAEPSVWGGQPVPTWLSALPATLDEVQERIAAAARSLVPQEAGNLVIERLWRETRNSLGALQRRFPNVLRRSTPATEADCRTCVSEEGARLLEMAESARQSSLLSRQSLDAWYDEELSRCTPAASAQSLECRIDFDGKRLLKSVVRSLNSEGAPLSFRRVQTLCAETLVEEYRNDRRLFGDDEFTELANAIQQLAPGEAVDTTES